MCLTSCLLSNASGVQSLRGTRLIPRSLRTFSTRYASARSAALSTPRITYLLAMNIIYCLSFSTTGKLPHRKMTYVFSTQQWDGTCIILLGMPVLTQLGNMLVRKSSLDGGQDGRRWSAATTGRTRGSAAIVHARPNVVQFTT